MAKTDNLKDFFNDLINTLKIKLSTSEPIRPKEVADKILDIDETTSGSFGESITCYTNDGVNSISDIIIFNEATSIGEYAYAGMTSLNDVIMFDGVTSIGKNAFNSDINLLSVQFPDTLTTIGEACFKGCSKLETIKGGNNVQYIEKKALDGTPFLENNTNDLVYVGNCLYRCKKVPDSGIVYLREGTTGLSTSSFGGKKEIKEIVCPSGLYRVGANAISNNENLKKIKLVSADDRGIYFENPPIVNNPNLEVLYISNLYQVDYNLVSECPNLKYVYILNDQIPSELTSFPFRSISSNVIFYVKEGLLDYWKNLINRGDYVQPYSEDNSYETK